MHVTCRGVTTLNSRLLWENAALHPQRPKSKLDSVGRSENKRSDMHSRATIFAGSDRFPSLGEMIAIVGVKEVWKYQQPISLQFVVV